jgi:4-amino-4-deoxy-L-arabinose transferase-like glycosyltransferase
MSRHAISVAAIVAVIACLALRISGPYDLWDQTQPRTVSYTSDIVANGRWILPVERGEFPATKPPLYNWLAAPVVAVAGYESELAHKLPSVLAMLLAAAALWLAARRIGGERSSFIAGAAVIAFAANYPIFKLCWLARPDMVLTLWLTGGWIAATLALERGRRDTSARRWALAFWLCTGLAALTKGPAALVLPIYAVIHARLTLGSWRSSRVIGWWWGTPLALAIVGWWAYAAWRTDPEHFRTVLWGSEIWGRVTGIGPEGNRKGPIGWVTDIYYMPLYFVARFAPWSILALMAMVPASRRTCTIESSKSFARSMRATRSSMEARDSVWRSAASWRKCSAPPWA